MSRPVPRPRSTARQSARLAPVLVAAVLATGGLAACGSSGGSSGSSRTVTVLAASSLTESFDRLGRTFEAQHPGVRVKLVYDSSATLAQMAEQGAPGDVLATADKTTMDQAESGGGTGSDPQQFATNVVTLAVPRSNPARITTLGDLDRSGVDYVTCVTTAPCGAATAALLRSNGVTADPVSEEVDVKSVLAKVTADEADAGFVYRTDVIAAGSAVKGITVPGASADPNTYWVARTSNARSTTLARDWITLMRSSAGQKVLTAAGFGTS